MTFFSFSLPSLPFRSFFFCNKFEPLLNSFRLYVAEDLSAQSARSFRPNRVTHTSIHIMNFTFHLVSLISLVLLKCVSSAPYGFSSNGGGRQEDAVVIEAAPSFSPVSSDSGYPAHNPVNCRHRIHYTPSSYSSGTNTRQSYQQLEPMTYQPFHNPGVVRIRQYPTSNSYETYRTPSTTVESPQYFRQQNNDIQESPQINQACNLTIVHCREYHCLEDDS